MVLLLRFKQYCIRPWPFLNLPLLRYKNRIRAMTSGLMLWSQWSQQLPLTPYQTQLFSYCRHTVTCFKIPQHYHHKEFMIILFPCYLRLYHPTPDPTSTLPSKSLKLRGRSLNYYKQALSLIVQVHLLHLCC